MVWLARVKTKWAVCLASAALISSMCLFLVFSDQRLQILSHRFHLPSKSDEITKNILPDSVYPGIYSWTNGDSKMSNNQKEAKKFIVFLKTHKTASSTVQNIILRHAAAHNLYIMFSKRKLHLNESGTAVQDGNIVGIPPGAHFNILCHHVLFNKEEIARFFPKQTIYISIIREPFQQFISSFAYYGQILKLYGLPKCIRYHPRDPILSYLTGEDNCTATVKNVSMVDNRMSLDLGFPYNDLEASRSNFTRISSFVREVDANFDFIMLVEYFEESIIMLRRLLNWDVVDMIYMKINVNKKRKSSAKFNHGRYNKTHRTLFNRMATLDIALYANFKKKFLDKLESQPPDFFDELFVFREIRLTVSDFCRSVKKYPELQPLTISRNKWTTGFTVTERECTLLMNTEEELSIAVRALQNLKVSSKRG